MAEKTRGEIDIAGSVAEVAAVLADLPQYPSWTSGMSDVEVLSSDESGRPLRATFSVSAGPVSDRVELGYEWSESGVAWHLISGRNLTALNGSYQWLTGPSGTRVTYLLELELAVSLPSLIKRAAEKSIVSSALQGLKKRVESA